MSKHCILQHPIDILFGNGACFVLCMTLLSLHNERSHLQALVQLGYPLLRDDVERKGEWLPHFVEHTFSRFLGCGDFRNGFAWLECLRCDSSHKIRYF